MDASVTMTHEIPGVDPDEGLARSIAHEMHHGYRNLLKTEDYVPNVQYKGIAQALYWLESEGIADMVTYDGMSQDEILREMGESWRPAYQHTDAYLARLDAAMKDVLRGSIAGKEASSHVKRVLTGDNAYHPVGFAMAQRIERQFGREALLGASANPTNSWKRTSGRRRRLATRLARMFSRTIWFQTWP